MTEQPKKLWYLIPSLTCSFFLLYVSAFWYVSNISDDFFQSFYWFQLFFCEKEIPKITGQSEQVKNDLFERGV
jgi:hypothetical protein